MNLHGQIMNLAVRKEDKLRAYSVGDALVYEYGHRDARHAAAELALEADAEIERLRAENEALLLYKNMAEQYGLSVFADIDALRKDAERYRWLCKNRVCHESMDPEFAPDNMILRMRFNHLCNETLDEAIDTAMSLGVAKGPPLQYNAALSGSRTTE